MLSKSYIIDESLPNLVEWNLKRLEREVLLMKQGETENQNTNHQDHCFWLEPEEIEARAKKIVRETLNKDKPHGVLDFNHKNHAVYSRNSPLAKSMMMESSTQSPQKHILSTYCTVVEEYDDGTRYEGEKYLNKRHGKGTFVFEDGFKYNGDWIDDQMSGYGKLFRGQFLVYEGDWLHSQLHGKGTMYNHEYRKELEAFDGSDFMKLKGGWTQFEGTFYKGMKNGLGTLSLNNEAHFCGIFKNDVVHGNGSFTQHQKTKVGRWEQNKLVGWF